MHPGIDGMWLAKSNKLIIPRNMLSVHLSADCCHCIWRSGHSIPAIQKRWCIPWRACRNCQSQFEPRILQIITFQLEPLLGCTLWQGRRGQISLRRNNQIPKIRPVLTRHIIQALRRSAPLSHTWHIDSQIHHPRGLWNLELHLDRRVAMHSCRTYNKFRSHKQQSTWAQMDAIREYTVKISVPCDGSSSDPANQIHQHAMAPSRLQMHIHFLQVNHHSVPMQ